MKVIKQAIVQKYRVATDTEVVDTKEGPVTARPGDAIVTDANNFSWPIPKEKFFNPATYCIDEQAGTYFKQPVVVDAELMHEAFSVKVSWNDDLLHGRPGDYKLTYSPGDYGVVAAEDFAATYVVVG